jgi:hypothetical protein
VARARPAVGALCRDCDLCGARAGAAAACLRADREPVEPEIEAARVSYRRALAGAFEARIRAALAGGHLPDQDAAAAAAALVGALIEGLIGPLAAATEGAARERVQALTLFALRALGVVDARARGLVVQRRYRRAELTSSQRRAAIQSVTACSALAVAPPCCS